MRFHLQLTLALFAISAAAENLGECEGGSEECSGESAVPNVNLLQSRLKFQVEADVGAEAEAEASEAMTGKLRRAIRRQEVKASRRLKKRSGSRSQVGRNNASSVERAAVKERQYKELIKSFAGTDYYPYDLMTCDDDVTLTTTSLCEDTYDEIVEDVQDLLDSVDDTCNSTYCPQAEFSGCVLRMAGHDFMDYKNGTGGSDGCVAFSDTDNAGLSYCLYVGLYGVSLQDAYSNWCSSVSLADFIVIAAEASMSWARDLVIAEDSNATDIDFASNFVYGRTTATTCSFSEDRLPNPENGCAANEEVFIDNLGLTWQTTTALMGVHSLGKATQANSGYDGWWSDTDNSRKFNNNYYVSMLLKGWIPEKNISGNSAKNQWQRGDLGAVTGDAHEMMLNTDLCLAFVCDSNYTTCNNDDDTYVKSQDYFLAADLDCCTWVFYEEDSWTDSMQNTSGVAFCGYDNYDNELMPKYEQAMCCDGQYETTTDIDNCQLPTYSNYVESGNSAYYVKKFAGSASTWLSSFITGWVAATGVGYSSLSSLDTTYVVGDSAGECDDDYVITNATTCLTALEDLVGITSVTEQSKSSTPYGCWYKKKAGYWNSKTTGSNSNSDIYPVCLNTVSC